MKKGLLTMILTCSVVWSGACLADVSVEPAGMKIVWKSLKKEFDGFQTYQSKEGVYVSLVVSGGDKGIIGFDKDKSKLSISDGAADLGGKFGMWNKISKDGKMMRLEVSSGKLPAVDTSKLKLTGNLEIVVASKTETKTNGPQKYKKGDKVEMSDSFKFEISEIGKPKWGDAKLSITLKWNRKIPELAAVRFYDEAGQLIESSVGGSSRGGFIGNYSVTRSYNLKKQSAILKIEMDLWLDAQKLTVPVNLEVGLGGAK